MRLKTEFIVGIFVLVVFSILAFMTFKVTDWGGQKKAGYRVYVYFKNISGIDEKTKVQVAGVSAGVIEKIELSDDTAKLTLRIYPHVKLYSDAQASIRATGLLGDKYLYIGAGKKQPLLKDGDTLKNTRELTDVDDLITNVSNASENINKLVTELNKTIADEEVRASLKETITNMRDITRTLKETIERNDQKFSSVLEKVDSLISSLDEMIKTNKAPMTNTLANLNKFTDSLKTDGPQIAKNLSKATEDLKTLLEENKPTLKSLSSKAESAMSSLSNITNSIERGEGTLGKFFKDERLYHSLTNAVTGISNTVARIERFRTFITFQGEYLFKEQDGKGYFYVTLQPKPDKYYVLGIVGDPVGRVSVTETTTNGTTVREEEVKTKLEFTAQFAKRFKDTALRIGLIESTFGAGIDHFLLKDKLKLTADIWDLSEDEYKAKAPHVKAGADYFLFKHIFLSAGIDNIFNSKRRGAYAGAGIKFEDEDFKYLFGTVPKIPGQ